MRRRAARYGARDEVTGVGRGARGPSHPAGGRRGGRLPHRAGSADERLPPRSGERVHRPARRDDDGALKIVDDGVGMPESVARVLASPRCASAPPSWAGVASSRLSQGGTQGLVRLPLPEGVSRLETLRVLIADDHPLFRKG